MFGSFRESLHGRLLQTCWVAFASARKSIIFFAMSEVTGSIRSTSLSARIRDRVHELNEDMAGS